MLPHEEYALDDVERLFVERKSATVSFGHGETWWNV